ncbi:hypothetical protein OG596_12120 [Streptomyces sp. NBC_01102]|uniref:hypothetical protein n=1 Tax=Streptomyces sp. NBC_01102 TaxID=2903749 RepID=UPI003866C173|nr:hypothetical protein OG596_12120 [Streptomyces sp. NBC_01102]
MSPGRSVLDALAATPSVPDALAATPSGRGRGRTGRPPRFPHHLVRGNARTPAAGLFAPCEPASGERDAARTAETLRVAVTPPFGEGHAPRRFRRDVTSATGRAALRYATAAREHHAVLLGPED